MSYDEIIGLSVRYFDYLGLERFGRIVFAEPSNANPNTVYVYIEDEESEFNVHEVALVSKVIRYAEIRESTEVYPDTRKPLL